MLTPAKRGPRQKRSALRRSFKLSKGCGSAKECVSKTLANIRKFRRITGGMNACTRALEVNGQRPAGEPVGWQVALIEVRHPPAREIHDAPVRDFTRIEPYLEPRLELQNADQQEEAVDG